MTSGRGRRFTRMTQLLEGKNAIIYDQVAETTALLASDRAGALTGTIVNATCGMVPG